MMSCTRCHRTGVNPNFIESFNNAAWNLITRSAICSSSLHDVSNRNIAFACPRWNPDGDVDVDSRHRLVLCLKSSCVMKVSMESLGAIRLHCRRICFVASVVSIVLMSYVPSSISVLWVDVAYGPSMDVNAGRVKGVPVA